MRFVTRAIARDPDDVAPDRSEIRSLVAVKGGSLVHCTLPPRRTSLAITHRTVDEIWFVLSGRAQVWRKHGEHAKITDVAPGVSLTIPCGTHFQFRTSGEKPFCFLAITMPPWPGEQEAEPVKGHWQV